MNIHEYQGKELLRANGVPVLEGVYTAKPSMKRWRLMTNSIQKSLQLSRKYMLAVEAKEICIHLTPVN